MDRREHAAILRTVRYIHRKTGIFLFAVFMIVAITGLLLGWKKNVRILQYPTQKGLSAEVSEWLPMDSLIAIANRELAARSGGELSSKIDKIDARPDKGVVKVLYADHYYSFQIDAVSGQVLSYEFRASDLVEHLHDGTWVDRQLGLPGGIFKLFYTTILGLALLVFTTTGFWMFYGPKRMRRKR
jgi:uncharacterized iron-regulated membrane protein